MEISWKAAAPHADTRADEAEGASYAPQASWPTRTFWSTAKKNSAPDTRPTTAAGGRRKEEQGRQGVHTSPT
eukprot:6151133-Amphidinium_carterae.1